MTDLIDKLITTVTPSGSPFRYDISFIKAAEAQFAPLQLRMLLFVLPITVITVILYGTYFFVIWLPLYLIYLRVLGRSLQAMPDVVSLPQFKRVLRLVLGSAFMGSLPIIYCVWARDPDLRYAGSLAVALSMVSAISSRSDDPWLRMIYGGAIVLQLIAPPMSLYYYGMDLVRALSVGVVSGLGIFIYVTGLRFVVETRTRLHRAAEAEFVDKNLTSLGQLTGGVAHDFNNLLTIIIGNLDLRDEMRGSDPIASEELLVEVRDAAGRAADLTSQLLAFSRKSDLAPELVELGRLIESSSALLQRLLPATHTLTLDLPLEPVHAQLDSKTFGTVLVNLVINARDAMADGGELVIRLHAIGLTDEVEGLPPGDYARVEVRDNGIGMSPELVTRALEPFYTTKPVGKGSGLGLSMAHGFAEQSNGKLTLQSDLGIGTVVRLWFPLVG